MTFTNRQVTLFKTSDNLTYAIQSQVLQQFNIDQIKKLSE